MAGDPVQLPNDLPGELDFCKPARPTRADLYRAIVASQGNLSKAARDLGTTRVIAYQLANDTPEIVALLADLRGDIVDCAEDNIFSDVRKGDAAASRLVVQTLGKDRGWAAGIEGTGKNGAITVEITQFQEAKSG